MEIDREQDKLITEMHTDIKYLIKFVDSAPDRFAAKWAEKIVAGIVGLIMITVGSAVIAGVVKAAEYIIVNALDK